MRKKVKVSKKYDNSKKIINIIKTLLLELKNMLKANKEERKEKEKMKPKKKKC